MTDGLKDVHREAIIAEIAANDRVERAVLFGSRATGTNTVSSDVDIALFGDRLTLTDQARLAAALDEIPMAQSVDLLLYDSIQDRTLREHIRRQGVEFYARPSPRPPSHRTRPTTNTCAAVMPNDVETASHWPRRDVRDLIRDGFLVVGDGYRAKNSELAGSGLPFARAGNIADGFRFSDIDRFPEDGLHRVGDKTSRPGDVVFTSKGTVGRFAFVRRDTEHFVYSPQLCFWRSLDREVIDPYFLYCWVRGAEFFGQFRGVAGQTDMAEYVSLTDQRCMFITLPPVVEQRDIAHILGTLDDKIELNRRMNATLEAMARALFRSWFVDFDPVRAKMEGRDTGLPKDIADLFPDRLVDSELGEIPEGWMAGTLGDIVSLNPESWGTGNPPKSVAYVDLTNTKWGCIERVEAYPWEQAPSRARRVLRKGDTMVATVRPGNGSFALIDEDGLTGSTGFAVLRPRRVHARELVWCAATSSDSIDRLAHLADGGAYPAVRPDAVLATPVVLADCRARMAFASSTAAQLDRIETNKRASRLLASLRDALLPKLVSGELRVNAREPRGGREGRPASVEAHGA